MPFDSVKQLKLDDDVYSVLSFQNTRLHRLAILFYCFHFDVSKSAATRRLHSFPQMNSYRMRSGGEAI